MTNGSHADEATDKSFTHFSVLRPSEIGLDKLWKQWHGISIWGLARRVCVCVWVCVCCYMDGEWTTDALPFCHNPSPHRKTIDDTSEICCWIS